MRDHQQIIFPIIIAFLIVIIIGPIVIPILEKLKMGQSVRGDGPKTHFKKSGTPTMGGIIIAIAVFFSVLITAQWEREMLFILLSILGFGFIGLDDFIKVVMHTVGASKRPQIGVSGTACKSATLYAYRLPGVGSSVLVPLLRSTGYGVWYLPFTAIIIFVGTVNSVNFTDGLTGLRQGHNDNNGIPSFCGVKRRRKGNCHNLRRCYRCRWVFSIQPYPAQIFIDTGSMALGGRWSRLSYCLDCRFCPLLYVYVLETHH